MKPWPENQKGQTTLETVVIGTTFLAFLSFILCIFYVGIVYTNLRFTSHELLVCPEYQQSQICLQDFRKSLAQLVRFGKIQNFQFNDGSASRKITFNLKFRILNIKNVDIFYQDQISLPLQID